MAGRYPETQIVRHPSFNQAAEKQEGNDALHRDRAKKLMPKGMTAAEKKIWTRIAPELNKLGRLKKHFVDFIQEYCVVKARMDAARVLLDEKEWTYITEGRHGVQFKSRPEVAQLNDDWRKWNSLVAQLGLSPATELRFNDKQGNLFDDDEYNRI